jgi:peptidoglycan/xylan/chitin deacetylase (PgdA/CDA1 family)
MAVEVVLDGMGAAGLEVERESEADLVYSATPPMNGGRVAVWVAASPAEEWERLMDADVVRDCMQALSDRENRQALIPFDLFRLVFALISGETEAAIPENDFGVPRLSTGSGGANLLRRPIVSEVVEHLSRILAGRVPSFGARIPRWPNRHSAAILLTHDVDRPYSRPRSAYYRERLRRRVSEGRFLGAMRSSAGWIRARLEHGRELPAERDPNFGFHHWLDVGSRLGARGCFYVAVRSSAEEGAHPADVTYDAAAPEMVRAMRESIDAGWEIGLHASIHCAREPQRFAEEKAILERLVGQRVRGVRHHYWNLGPHGAAATWRAHQAAGLEYDSSLGTNDSPGFRRGLAWPFWPRTEAQSAVLQIPPTLMDGGIFYAQRGVEEGRRDIQRHLDQVIDVGGAAVLDWHLEQANPDRLNQAGPALVRALEPFRERSDIWWPRPTDLADWWKERFIRRQALLRTRDRVSVRAPRAPRRDRRSRDAGRSVPG